jgi:hypothetical protein
MVVPGRLVRLERLAGLSPEAVARYWTTVGSTSNPLVSGLTTLGGSPGQAVPHPVLSPEEWAQINYGAVQLGDRRRAERAQHMAARMAAMPGASLPKQMRGSRAELRAAYGLLHRDEAQLAALSKPHWEQTRREGATHPQVLLVEDFSTLSLFAYRKTMAGVGRVGTGNKGWGMMVHTTLMVLPGSRQVLGVAHQQVLERVPLNGTRSEQRPKEERISRAWPQSLEAIGPVPQGRNWLLVADREADFLDLLLTCRRLNYGFCIRVWQNRVLAEAVDVGQGTEEGTEQARHLLAAARSFPPVVEKEVQVPARGGLKARIAKLEVSYGEVSLRVPKGEAPFRVYVVRAYEVNPPKEVKEPLEWVLATTEPIHSAEDALQLLEIYACRWVVEDYHQCLKTGCGIEKRDFEDVEYLEHLLGFLGPLAAWLLQLRDAARRNPEQPAAAVADELTVAVLAADLGITTKGMSARAFWRNVARLGGFLGRKRDGEPGWKSLWAGWLKLEALVRGARLALALYA